ncbi:MAG: efflux RND transporter periplasmic adaptor subunit [candidate division KSB1 bacterium]|nr:efflux RND transporter periplasmic adaptor subunit [candidate division KSB1 bacterium]MDZ7334319.1 efflux RND transporter periplasmic adaptor subunit [candidate division KSB1 bacterium]MDZ7356463.1 efflux RND transporter periplasmic adaptor subunit [candidate division KSB1 bacterium]MDZ7400470.1 efflux RND transporter periplasmic adaptor subunit [candidate division KSB1 bacterium]
MSRKKWIIGGIVAAVGVIALLVGLSGSKSKEVAVQVEKVTRGNITQMVSASGKVQPEVEVKISANISAEIIGLYVKEGDQVRKGQLLVELDRTKYLAAVDRARSNKKSREANLLQAQSVYKRTADLYRQNLTSQADLEKAEADLKLAEGQLEQAEADLKQAEDDLTKTKLYAPMDGTVTKVNKEVGEIALGSMFQADVILVVSDLSRMDVISEVDENDVVLVSYGDTAKIEVDAIPDTVLKGYVRDIAHSATTRGKGTQDEITNFEVKIALIDKEPRLRPGMSATVDIATETRYNVLKVPIQAVTARERRELAEGTQLPNAKSSRRKTRPQSDEASEQQAPETINDELVEVVFVVDNKVAKIVPVKTGISSDTEIEIISGLEEGQTIVAGSYRALSKLLKHGSIVKVSDKPMLKSD